mmetsp:Transcript_314/g.443  ORF Transcript_314/g.443 Transcript_314/m.443 type:complete len:488 (-) Transcript_314:404-1867(-)
MDHHQVEEYTGAIPLDEQDLSISDMKSIDYFSIDLNNYDDMSDCSSVSLPSIIDGKRIFLRRQLSSEDGDEEDFVALKPEVIEPSSHFQPVYTSDDELSFVTFEEESFYTYTTINRSEHTSVHCSAHIHIQSPSASHRRGRRRTSDPSASQRKSLSLSNHSSRSSRPLRRGGRRGLSHDDSISLRRSQCASLRKALLQEQVDKIARELAEYGLDDEDELEEELEEHDDFSYKSLDFNKRAFGPSAEALLEQRQAGSKRDLLGVSGHTTDAIVHNNKYTDTSSDDHSRDMSMDMSLDESGDFSFYEEETLEGSVGSQPSEAFEIRSPSPQPMSKPPALSAAISGYTSKTMSDAHSDSSYTQSLTESVEEDDYNDLPLPVAPAAYAAPQDLADMTPKVDHRKKAWARRQQCDSKLQQLKKQMNSVYGAPLGHLPCSASDTDPLTSMDSMPRLSGYLGVSGDSGNLIEASLHGSSTMLFNASRRSSAGFF